MQKHIYSIIKIISADLMTALIIFYRFILRINFNFNYPALSRSERVFPLRRAAMLSAVPPVLRAAAESVLRQASFAGSVSAQCLTRAGRLHWHSRRFPVVSATVTIRGAAADRRRARRRSKISVRADRE